MNIDITITRDDAHADFDPFSVIVKVMDEVVECEGEDHEIAIGETAFVDCADVHVCVAHFGAQIVAVLT